MRVVCQPYPLVAFDDDTGVRALRGDAWEGRIEESWYAGLGPLGGYVMAIVLRAIVPPFTGRVTMETRFGAPPFSGADRSEVGGWMGLREERPVDALTVALLADAWFPAPWPRLRKLAPAPTIELTVHFRAPLPLPDSLLLGRFNARLVREGFFDEDGELWTPDGTLVARSRQLGLLLDPEL